MLKKNNENEILKTFESMLRKKMQKNLEQASIQSRGMVSKSIVGIYGNKMAPKVFNKSNTIKNSSRGGVSTELRHLEEEKSQNPNMAAT